VTAPDVVVSLRPPLFARIWACAFPFIAATILFREVSPGTGMTKWVFPLAFLAVGCVLAVVLVRQRVDAYADGRLVVRNRLGGRTFDRGDVGDVAAGPSGASRLSNWRLELVLIDGSPYPLTVTEHPPLPGVRRRVERDAARLREWLTGRPAPFL